jgi:hypothetical protein
MKHAVIPKYDIDVSLDYGLCNWMRIWFIRIRHITSSERRLSRCYVGETVNGVVYLFDLLWQLSKEIIIIPYWTAEQNYWKFFQTHT